MNITEARSHIADAIRESRLFRANAVVAVRPDAPEGSAVVNCDWALRPSLPAFEVRCRMVTIMVDQRAMTRYRTADEAKRAIYNEAIVRRIKMRMTTGGYRETDPCNPALIVHVGLDVLKEVEPKRGPGRREQNEAQGDARR